jgi:hypothetical protein
MAPTAVVFPPSAARTGITVAANNVTIQDLQVIGTTGASTDGIDTSRASTLPLRKVQTDASGP